MSVSSAITTTFFLVEDAKFKAVAEVKASVSFLQVTTVLPSICKYCHVILINLLLFSSFERNFSWEHGTVIFSLTSIS